MSAPTPRSRRADWLEYYWGGTGLWILVYAAFLAASLTFVATADWIPWWAVLGLIPPFMAGAWVINGLAHGYRLATDEEAAQIRAGHLWHMTGSTSVYDAITATAQLDPARCRWITRMWRRDRPLRARRSRAVYAFTNPPRPGQTQIHVRRDQRALLLRLEGSHIEGDIYVRPGGVVALASGYHGPAHIES